MGCNHQLEVFCPFSSTQLHAFGWLAGCNWFQLGCPETFRWRMSQPPLGEQIAEGLQKGRVFWKAAMKKKTVYWVLVSNNVLCSPLFFGKWSILTNIVQMGWKPPTSLITWFQFSYFSSHNDCNMDASRINFLWMKERKGMKGYFSISTIMGDWVSLFFMLFRTKKSPKWPEVNMWSTIVRISISTGAGFNALFFWGGDVLRRMVFGDGAYLAVNPLLNLIKVLYAWTTIIPQ